MCEKKENAKKTVADAYVPCVERFNLHDSMHDLCSVFDGGANCIAVTNDQGELIGTVFPSDMIRFQHAYFENLRCSDRRNEFLFEDASDPEIHFVPIDRISRYMNDQIETVDINDNLEQAESRMAKLSQSCILVKDEDDQVVGSLSLLNLIQTRLLGNCCRNCKKSVPQDSFLAQPST